MSGNSQHADSFQYFLSDKVPMLIVTFLGDMNFAAADKINRCREEIAAIKDIRYVILYFRDVDTVNGEAIGALTQLQLEIRGRSCELKVCSLKPHIKDKLINMGVVRKTEISNNLRETVLAIVPEANAAAAKKAS